MPKDSPTYTLENLGADFQVRSAVGEGQRLGRIVRLDRGLPLVATDEGMLRSRPSTELIKNASSVGVIGDWVLLAASDDHDTGIIEGILPRHGALLRRDPGEDTSAQTIAANIDTVFVAQSLSGAGVNPRRLEREMVLAWESGATPVVILTKADLARDVELEVAKAHEAAPDVEVIVVCPETGAGIEEVRAHIPFGNTAVVLGESGVGKSTLINALVGEEVAQVGEVREHDDRGRHTTVAREMILLPKGGVVIDTPGIRSLALWGSTEGLDQAFPEISSAAERCRFRDCTHTREPDCAVKEGVDSGKIDPSRYDAYLALSKELGALGRLQEDKARLEKESPVKANRKQRSTKRGRQ